MALVAALSEAGQLDWPSWHARFLDELAGAPDSENGHYQAWLTAVERVLADRGMITEADRPVTVPDHSHD